MPVLHAQLEVNSELQRLTNLQCYDAEEYTKNTFQKGDLVRLKYEILSNDEKTQMNQVSATYSWRLHVSPACD
jgi:hypothetical protein